MAQAVGVLLLRKLPADDNKIAFFMSVDKVKFRQAVEPGDSVEIRVKLVKTAATRSPLLLPSVSVANLSPVPSSCLCWPTPRINTTSPFNVFSYVHGDPSDSYN